MKQEKRFYVYMLTNQTNGTLYIGVTSDLVKRVWEHRQKAVEGFTQKYGLDRLVYYEVHDSAESAITREKQMKEWQRNWKLRRIAAMNPEWNDLYEEIAS